MSCRNDAECEDYLCRLESEIVCLLCAKLVHVDLMYYITTFKAYVIKINKLRPSTRTVREKRTIMIDQLNGIIRAYENLYLSKPDDSDSSSDRSGNGSSDEDFVLPTEYKNYYP